MAFTKRHYNEVARIIQEARGIRLYDPFDPRKEKVCAFEDGARFAVKKIQEDLKRMFAADNPRFDGTRFDMACEPKGGE